MPNDEPPPIVTNLEPDRTDQLCPGETITVVATTSPSGAIVAWSIAIDGGPPQPVQGDGNTFKIFSGRRRTIVITASLTNSLSVTASWKEADVKIELEPDPADGSYVISAEPQMQPPVVMARAVGIGGAISVLEWRVSVGTSGFSDCPPNGPDLDTTVDLSPTGGGEQIAINLENVIRGFGLGVSVRGIVNGCEVSGFGGSGIDGTNPQQSDIQAALPHDTLRRIACKESGQRQFDAPPNGGTGFCPLFGPGGKVGIMQIPDPSADEVWNWRLNVAKGIEVFNEKVDAARAYPSKVRNSEEFERLVFSFNQGRQQQGLVPIQVILPDFTTGNFDDDDNLQELELDAIRGYNGWAEDKGQFGLDLHEFRVAVDRIDGEEVLVVINVNEETLQGEAVWEGVPVADRPTAIGAPNAPNYVEEVLAFDFGCSPAPTPTCPTVSITVDPSDTKTHEIPGTSPFPPFIVIGRHFVTVKGAGDIVLRAAIHPDTPRLRSQLTWEADGAAIKQGADRLTAKISRNTPSGARIPVRVKLGSQTCKEFLVWIIWCTLKPTSAGMSSLNGQPLGSFFGRDDAQGLYKSFAGIDFTATIHPAEIITDTADRPAIIDQQRRKPPGPDTLDRGVADLTNPDKTNSGFVGWDMSRQIRLKVFKGNPDKVPSEPIAETTAPPDPKADPIETDRPIPAYPKDDPADPLLNVVGNDDNSVGADEDSNPYDQGAGVPGKGTRGTLRSRDGPDVSFEDAFDHSGKLPGENGDTYRRRVHFREFVRVQLGTTWYRCSGFGLWRWHMHAKRLNGKWNAEPGNSDFLDDSTNDGF